MNTAASRQKPPRRYAFACAQCRKKKIRCDGEQPACRRCRQSDEECHYAQRATESRLEQAKSRIEWLEAELADARHSISPDSSSRTQARASFATPSDRQRVEIDLEGVNDPDDISPHVGLDEHGEITYHGPTSRFSDGGLADWHVERPPHQMPKTSQEDHIAALENNYVMLSEVWEPLLESKTEQDLGAEPGLVHQLLNWFWIWQYPLHNYLYRPCFIMDMALGGPYYSKFLLHCILALSARHLDAESAENDKADKGEKFLASAKELLIRELGATKPRIPTIQGLLVLSGRQCAVGKTSEGWLYLGMAIRMMTDLGLHLNFQELMYLEKLTPIELEVRKRLYCSAYIWDKSLSLSLGRPPALSRLPASALEFLDHADDQYIWLPPDFPDYPSTDNCQTTCFKFFCRLGTIVEMIMQPLPRGTSGAALKERQKRIETKLQIWHEELPAVLKMDPHCEVCPPPHIMSLNLLYHTLHIILWRPYLNLPESAARASQVCIDSSQTVHDIFVVYGRTFHWRKMSYLVSYCLYTASTIQVHEMRSADTQRRQDATKRLASLLQILEGESRQTPGIRRSIHIIKRQLRTWTPNRTGDSPHAGRTTQQGTAQVAQQNAPTSTSVDQTWRGQTSAPVLPPLPSETYGQFQPAVQSNPNLAWSSQQDPMDSIMGNDFGFGFVDTSAGFHLPWSFDETSNFGYFDEPFIAPENTM